MRKLLITTLLISVLCCKNKTQQHAILLADREAPLGWVYLRVYKDSTFEFELRGLERRGKIYKGFVSLKKDTIYFQYRDSIPKAGKAALITNDKIFYLAGEYHERLDIKLNKLNN